MIVRMLNQTPPQRHTLEPSDIHIAKVPSRNTGGDWNVINSPNVLEIVLPVVTTDTIINLLVRSVLRFQDQMGKYQNDKESLPEEWYGETHP
jgi:hypothetical protein